MVYPTAPELPSPRACLSPDLEYWQKTVQQLGRKLTVQDLLEQMRISLQAPVVGMMIIKSGMVFTLYQGGLFEYANLRVSDRHIAMNMILISYQFPQSQWDSCQFRLYDEKCS